MDWRAFARKCLLMANVESVAHSTMLLLHLVHEPTDLHARDPKAARTRSGEMIVLRDRLLKQLQALRQMVIETGFNRRNEAPDPG